MPIRASFLAAVLLVAGAPYAKAESPNVFLPELELYVEMTDDVRLGFLASTTNAVGVTDADDRSLGFYVEYLGLQQPLWIDDLTPDRARRSRLSMRLGYQGSVDRSSDRIHTEQWIGQGTFRILPVKKTSFSNTSRFVYQDVQRSDTDWFYLNASRLERNVAVDGILVTPFVGAEFAYAFRRGGWDGALYGVGIAWAPIADRLVLELSLNRQEQFKPERTSLNALGLTLSFFY